MNKILEFWNPIWLELELTHFPVILLGSFFGGVLLRGVQYPRQRLKLVMLAYYAALFSTLLVKFVLPGYLAPLRLATLLIGYAVLGSQFTHLIFERLIPRLGAVPPRILQDLFFAGLMLFSGSIFFSTAGYNLSALIPTSAVLTAVLGLALQDTLGNFISGMTLQMDHSLTVGDWIRVEGLEGRVSEIHWRYLALETRNWETVILPNSLLMKNKVLVLGKRQHQPQQWRRWVYFQVDYQTPPSEVLAAAGKMLQREAGFLPQVSDAPAPNCILISYELGYAKYAIRYWLTDLALDDPTDHEIRTRLYFALQRAGIQMAMTQQQIFMKEKLENSRLEITPADVTERINYLAPLELFQTLKPQEREWLAQKLVLAPFGKGEVLTRQGAEGHWLYIIQSGNVSVQMKNEQGLSKEVRQLGAGDFFGEMSLLTGAPRTATVIALSEVICYQLDKNTFQMILQKRPELAEYLADVLVRRQSEYRKVKKELAQENEHSPSRENLLEKISRFFSL
ncbi:mechanosensitive ion channel protein MscS [bacterium (Candidatus Blackallbacteria) CG17_big_fil_post_rev_8_21_14_2_50_48_46]|uniref:Mechanosensitive ion channel protein MscS n=1 Tax=bacterium (Candidatus Blackallbacteria) CG17_big_fil_post_rev_8_21_14_2_50_48_46 TaxID=2014261 RepID=A0A2M7G1J8_9BACT|nr:MAG: mechanosensitive ion channel protein MscS [bacterium (Candidatus Blackallbacteria) CG18_big_fil_WC_8_21_14_2_50_49_26]PIW15497.1 MAG: mechanosensitive ion channel protein MscS [bacterium (Candidatus Blackallbacteria) CG17_big_fil_post_rev_8_21_14_2_50_48_46]PIW48603.1 MAG: mechanosensitive ion channel protein MscS [bacterium (Candidatus Blackallbacteria) CG13_big_fil_rev_8_21_14_2_50_49_14]